MYKLMIVDDEAKIRNGLHHYFPWNEIGFEVVAEADNGKAALDYILHNPVDAMLCDIRMPVMSGIDLARELQERQLKVKIVFLSGYRDFEYARQALLYGAMRYIVKPTKYEELVEVFKKVKEEFDAEKGQSQPQGQLDNEAETDEDAHEPQGYHEKKIEAIKAYVQEHYASVTLSGTADHFHMNLYYLSKYFKKWTGQNFSEYLTSVRMEKAAELLQDITYMTYEIGRMVGYEDPKHFSRAFRQYFGVSPREYREAER
ncbi:MAG: Two component transcriptional regulator, AraC family [Paenibacillaceae bacterium]|jgi:YesN/AraC family two-component response regulator|nr:Two component transcriptional regulator, AraC family [Paenibacillaceae bacterium]